MKLSEVNNYIVLIELEVNTTAQFSKFRSVSTTCALKTSIEKKLDKLESQIYNFEKKASIQTGRHPSFQYVPT